MSKEIKFWLTKIYNVGHSFEREDLVDLFKQKYNKEPSDNEELYEFFKTLNIYDIEKLDSYCQFEEDFVDGNDIKDIDCEIAFD